MPAFHEARTLILESVSPLGVERVSLADAAGRAIGEDVQAPGDMPPWDNSAMDGYAVRSLDCREPATLDVLGYQPAGGEETFRVGPGGAVRIMTGSPIPDGADAVVPLEETVASATTVSIVRPVNAGEHVRRRAEDVRAGDLVVRAGTTLRAPEIGMLASFGRAVVPVHRRARVAVLSTGDELTELGEPLSPGKLVNSNSLSIAAALHEIGAMPTVLGIARDTVDSLREKIAEGLRADALITTAGVSMGDRDLVRNVLEDLSVRLLFWKIDVRPGHPTAFGLKDRTPVFALPGNPVSCLVMFEELARPALLRMMGHAQVMKPLFSATLAERVEKKAGRVLLLRVRIEMEDGRPVARTSGDQRTGIFRTMLRANGIAVIPAEKTVIEAGEAVAAHYL